MSAQMTLFAIGHLPEREIALYGLKEKRVHGGSYPLLTQSGKGARVKREYYG